MKKVMKTVQKYIFKSMEDYITIHAAYSTLFIFMSIFPLAVFIIALLTRLNVSREYLLQQFYNITPVVFHEFIRDILESTAEASTTFVFSIAIIVMVWSSSAGVYGLLLGLNDVYRTYDTRSYIHQRSVSIFYTLLIILVVAFSLLFLVFGNSLLTLLLDKFENLSTLWNFLENLRYPVLFLLFVFAFNLIYFVFPHIRTRFFMHLPGAVFSSAGWLLLSYLFSLYFSLQKDGFTMYGSLTTVVMFLFWLWLGMCIIFLGGEVNAMLIDKRFHINHSPIREQNIANIRKIETDIRSHRKMTSQERKNLRKSTTRQIDTRRIREELERQEARNNELEK